MAIDTSRILFIAGGAFCGIEKNIAARLNLNKQRPIGIEAAKDNAACELSFNELIEKADVKDLLKFGMIPEFLGRFPVICPMKELSEQELRKVLTEPKNAIIKQYSRLLEFDGISLTFDDDALSLIAKNAITNGTGARGLRSEIEKILADDMFSCRDDAKESDKLVHISADTVRKYLKAA